jgi:hypothetical protein
MDKRVVKRAEDFSKKISVISVAIGGFFAILGTIVGAWLTSG